MEQQNNKEGIEKEEYFLVFPTDDWRKEFKHFPREEEVISCGS